MHLFRDVLPLPWHQNRSFQSLFDYRADLMLHFFKCLGALQYTHAALYHKKLPATLVQKSSLHTDCLLAPSLDIACFAALEDELRPWGRLVSRFPPWLEHPEAQHSPVLEGWLCSEHRQQASSTHRFGPAHNINITFILKAIRGI